MNRMLTSLASVILCASASAQEERSRPPITGIAAVQFYSTNMNSARSFYTRVMSGEGTPSDACRWCERSSIGGERPMTIFPFLMQLSSGQNLVLATAPKTPPSNLRTPDMVPRKPVRFLGLLGPRNGSRVGFPETACGFDSGPGREPRELAIDEAN